MPDLPGVRTVTLPPRCPVTDETVRRLEAAGLYDLAEVARKYVKRPSRLRRWLRFWVAKPTEEPE